MADHATFIAESGSAAHLSQELKSLPAWSRAGGYVTQRRFAGTWAEMLAKQDAMIAAGADRTALAPGTDDIFWTLTAEFGGQLSPTTGAVVSPDDQVVVTWNSSEIEVVKTLWELPGIKADLDRVYGTGFTDAGLQGRRRVRQIIEALVRGEATVPSTTNPTASLPLTIAIFGALLTSAGLNAALWRAFLADLLRGVDSFAAKSYLLRRTVAFPLAASYVETSARVGRMLRYATLKSAEGYVDGASRVQLPTNGYWLKKGPASQFSGDGRGVVTTDFIWTEDYSFLIYGNPV